MIKFNNRTKSEAGFTLVELAIVMIIIGLLIAGVLKGQQLIGNARVTSTVAQLKAIDAATSTFKDMYQGMPGDLATPATRLPNCTSDCSAAAGNGDGKLGTDFTVAPGTEAKGFFPQLAAADLVTGIVVGGAGFGGDYPQAKLDGNGIVPGSVASGAGLGGAVAVLGTSAGLYLAILPAIPTAAVTAANVGMNPSQASRIDTKLDDGVPTSGSTVAIGAGTGTGCASGTTATSIYNTNLTSNVCGLYTRIQG